MTEPTPDPTDEAVPESEDPPSTVAQSRAEEAAPDGGRPGVGGAIARKILRTLQHGTKRDDAG